MELKPLNKWNDKKLLDAFQSITEYLAVLEHRIESGERPENDELLEKTASDVADYYGEILTRLEK